MVQAVIYARVSTQDQDCARQIRDLNEFAMRAGYEIVGTYEEKASGMKNDRTERRKVINLARQRKVKVILVTEMTRWGRSLQDLLDTLKELNSWGVSVVAQTGFNFDLSTPQGKLVSTMLGALGEFERDLIRERTLSGLAAAKAKGRIGGRRKGENPSDKYAGKVLKMIGEGISYRDIASRLAISKTTVTAIVKRNV